MKLQSLIIEEDGRESPFLSQQDQLDNSLLESTFLSQEGVTHFTEAVLC